MSRIPWTENDRQRTHQSRGPYHPWTRSSQSTRRDVKKYKRCDAQVQALTMPDAMSPGLTLRLALVNSSALVGEKPV